ncbi:MAG TPA: glycosyltransferase family 87 protein [Rhizobiaceae bacterium]|nr:glycosyltransferase family 87 protein [Rhizobiaceae bacterium]
MAIAGLGGFSVQGDQLTDRPLLVRRVLWLLLIVTLASAALVGVEIALTYAGSRGLLVEPGRPFGDDFINLWTVALLVKDGAFDAIYLHTAFEQFQQTLTGEYMGDRLWAYPPHSLFFTAPFAYLSYLLSFLLWTGLGLAVLAGGARRLGFGWLETAIIVFSPAAMLCVVHGQSGNLVAGLLLIALSGDGRSVRGPALAAALLTVKPQAGFLLPVLWLIQRRWALIVTTSLLALGLMGLSAALFGLSTWKDYAGDTLPALSSLEWEGWGAFLYMIPSVFISMRLLDFTAESAFGAHVLFAGIVFAALLWRLVVVKDAQRRVILVLAATCLITPYLHVYDMTILLAASLLLIRALGRASQSATWLAIVALIVSWLLPRLVMPLGAMGLPLSPLLILAVFAIACFLTRDDAGQSLSKDRQIA